MNSLALVVVVKPSFREMRMGGASLSWNHSSASTDGSGPMVSGYRSSWKRSDCAGHRGEPVSYCLLAADLPASYECDGVW